MILSMTGFGKGVAESNNKRFTIELKSLNSKQLDLACRMPAAYKELELEMRNVVTQRLERGKVDFTLYVEHLGNESDVTLNIEKVVAYKRQIENMSETLGLPAPDDWYNILLRLPDVFHCDAPAEVSEDDKKAFFSALHQALDNLIEFRKAEGVKLDQFFRQRIANITAHLAEVPKYENERIAKIRLRMEEALEKIHHADYDRGRYEQEMIFYIEKLDVNEEKQRLAQHLAYFIETMDTDPGQGKKLGFISQEMGREINTLGSKSNHAEMQIVVVKMKDELEQIKEQVLNVM